MKILVAFFLLSAHVSFSQMDDFNRLNAAAEIDFGYSDKLYPDTFYVSSLDSDTAAVYFIINKPENHYIGTDRIAYRRSDSTVLSGTVILQTMYRPHTRYNEDYFSQRYSFMALLYVNGQMRRAVHRKYVKTSNTYFRNSSSEYEGRLFEHENKGYRYSEINGSQYMMSFHTDGSIYTLKTKETNRRPFNEPQEHIKFHANGQLKLYYKNHVINNTRLAYTLLLDEKGDTICQLVKRDIYNYGWIFRPIPEDIRRQYSLPYAAVISSESGRDYSFLKSKKNKSKDDAVMHKFLKKNRKRIEALQEY